jgi:hypothetical protein
MSPSSTATEMCTRLGRPILTPCTLIIDPASCAVTTL